MLINRDLTLAATVGLAMLYLPATSSALVEWTFTSSECIAFDGGSCNGGDNLNNPGDELNWSTSRTYRESVGGDSGPNVVVTGWANTAGLSGNEGDNDRLEQGQITHYNGNGLGMRNADHDDVPATNRPNTDAGEGDSPEHAIDNDERFDFVLFDFGDELIDLSSISLGWFSNDADISVLAYTGDGDPTLSADPHYIGDRELTATGEDLTTAGGWTLIGNYDVNDIDNSDPYTVTNINAGRESSSYWLVGTYAEAFADGGCSPGDSYCQSDYEDHVKLLAIAGDVIPPPPPPDTRVPEPATLLLTAAGALAMVGVRRRRRIRPAADETAV